MGYGREERPKAVAVLGEKVEGNILFSIGANDRGYGQIVLKQENGAFVNTSLYEPTMYNINDSSTEEEVTAAKVKLHKDQYSLISRLTDFLATCVDQNNGDEYKACRKSFIKRFQDECESYADVLTLAEQMFKDEDYSSIPLTCKIVVKNNYPTLPRFGPCVQRGDFEGESMLVTKYAADGTPYDVYERNVEVEA
jgi:hypothetical protein